MAKVKCHPRKRRAAYLLACGSKNYTGIAEELGITVQTLWNYRQDESFNREVQYFTNWIEKSFSFILISKYFSVKCLKS